MVPPDSQRISRARCYLGTTSERRTEVFVYGAITRYGWFFQCHSTNTTVFLTPRQDGSPDNNIPTTPTTQPLPGITRDRFSLDPLSLATTHGITVVFSSCGY